MKIFLTIVVTAIIVIDLEKCFPKYLLVNLDDTGDKGEFASFFLAKSKTHIFF